MKIIERIIGIIAPPSCVVCGNEGSALCAGCRQPLVKVYVSKCIYCGSKTTKSRTCKICRHKSRLYAAYAATSYQLAVKALLHRYKFKHQRAAVKPIADLLSLNALTFITGLPDSLIVVPMPTTGVHQRQRSFDHSNLLAQTISRRFGITFKALLKRSGHLRQVGAQRPQRIKQLKGTFYVPDYKLAQLESKNVLLIDDVMTTGASLEEAARALRAGGAKRVYALVLAKK